MSIEILREIGVPDDVIDILIRCHEESQKSLPQQFKDATEERKSWAASACIEKLTPPQKCPNHRKPAKRLRRSKS